MSFMQIGFLTLNLLFLPTSRLLRERQEALENRLRRKQRDENETKSPYSIEDEFELNPDYDPATVWQRIKRLDYKQVFSIGNVVDNIKERPFLTLGILGSSALITSALVIYAHRMAHMITLLPNDRVRFSSFSVLAIGEPPTIEIPLRNVSCIQGRKSKNNYSILKFKGYKGYHLVHKSEGQFIEPKLYDKYLGYQRSWAQK